LREAKIVQADDASGPADAAEQSAGTPLYLSLGAGLQSSTLALLCASGDERFPEPKAAIFADTMWEPAHVYETVEWLAATLPYPVLTVSDGNLYEKQHAVFTSVPFHLNGGSMGNRQCSREAKIDPVARKIREMEGMRPRQRMHPVDVMLGITVDEIRRAKPSRFPWMTHRFPLIDAGLKREDMRQMWAAHAAGRALPGRSSCRGCPYHSDRHWIDLADNDPAEFARAVEEERSLQDAARRLGAPVPFFRSSTLTLDVWMDRVRAQQVLPLETPPGEDCSGYCDA